MNRLILNLTALFALGAFVLCGWLSPGMGRSGAAEEKPALKLGQEDKPADEEESIKKLIDVQLHMMEKTDPDKRGQHPMHHGCVEAKITIRDGIPEQYRFGIFKEAKSYDAKIRFSNGAPKADTERHVHGMAIKVLGVKGARVIEKDGREDQDFVLIDSEVFFASDAKTQLPILEAVSAMATKEDLKAFEKLAKEDPVSFKLFMASRKAPPSSPLTIQYWSTVPFKLGDGAVKYTAEPVPENGPGDTKRDKADFLRTAMVDRLGTSKTAVVFNLSIIPQKDPKDEPIENPTIRWKSDPIPVATIEIAPQTFDTPERMKQCEEASFDPWHALAEHRPLGGINRARKAVYAASVEARTKAREKAAAK